MDQETLVRLLDSPAEAATWLRSCRLEDVRRGHRNLLALANQGITFDLLTNLFGQLEASLPDLSDPDMALNNLERFVASSRSPLALATLFERDREALPILLQIFSISQYLSDVLICDPESYDLLRVTEGQPVARDVLVHEICGEVDVLEDDDAVMAVLRRYKHRETLRIAYGDLIQKQRLEVVTEQISFLADAICEAALRAAWRRMSARRGIPRRPDGQRARLVVLALGKLGGTELNYSSDIDLVLLSDEGGQSDGPRSIGNQEFFDRLASILVKYVTEPTSLGSAYRVDLRLRPDGTQGPAVISVNNAYRYYDLKGRNWERQAFVKARPVAGDRELGREFLQRMEPWIYRRYLSSADIAEIKAIKRRMEQRVRGGGADTGDVKTGRGGIRDIEFVIQFLQLLNGGDLPDIRTGNTLQAMDRLERAGCLTLQERTVLEENYVFLRKVEHRLQLMFDLQTHALPADERELRRLAIRMGFDDRPAGNAFREFNRQLRTSTERNRTILNHLLSEAFGSDAAASPETDLVLDPEPPAELVQQVLTAHGFRDPQAAHANLMALASERIAFLSSHRCRHFLASIAAPLLAAIGATPDPDGTLVNLSKVSESLGGKGMLWELFQVHPPSLHLYVRLCAASPYLSGILISNPGMIDELMDSLMLDRLPTFEWLSKTLNELCRNAEDVDPILHSFKNSQHLRVGVRDILGKEDIRDTHRALASIAEVCLKEITDREYDRLVSRYGVPVLGEGEPGEAACSPVILAMGKLGGREPNYHSDLDLIFLYDGEGRTRPSRSSRSGEPTTNQHFFNQLGQRIIKVVTAMGPYGRLYELDPRLRPTGKSGMLAVSIGDFARYFETGRGQLWERQALCKARPIYGTADAQRRAMEVVHHCLSQPPWQSDFAEAIRRMRYRLQDTATPRNLKRGAGGTMDVEFIVQMLQLKYAAASPDVLVPGTLDAIDALHNAGYLSEENRSFLSRSYRCLRRVEAGLRLMNTTARHDLPDDEGELKRLAFLVGYDHYQTLVDECRRYRHENRAHFERLFAAAAASPPPV